MTGPRGKNGKFIGWNTIEEQLAANTTVLSNGCIEWNGALDKYGYGKITFRYRTLRTHRVAYELRHKCALLPGEQLNHTCHNRKFCNPDHLYLGTQQQNIADRDRDGYPASGEKHPMSKLKVAHVAEIRSLISLGWTSQKIADKFGVSRSAIDGIKCGRTWRANNGQ